MIQVQNLHDFVSNINTNKEPEPAAPDTLSLPQPTDGGADPIQLQANLAAKLGARVEITGSWVWAQFNTRPEASILVQLKTNKWIWCKSKCKWAWRGAPCHSKRTMSWEYITHKYGVTTINNSEDN